jgi:tetratricopeptide (TPR) repeat protein
VGFTVDSDFEQAWLAHDFARVELEAEARSKAPHALLWLGLAQAGLGRLAQAQGTLKKAFEHARADPPALHAAANRLLDLFAAEPLPSVELAHFIVDGLKLEHPASLRLIAEDIALREQDAVRAATTLKRALAVDPSDAETHYLLARLLARLGKKPNVLKHLQAAIKHGEGLLSAQALAKTEPDFELLRRDADFLALLQAP